MIKRRTKVLLTIAILMQISSYFLPFMSNVKGYQFFGEGVNVFFKEGIVTPKWYMFYAFFAPILSFPILLISLFKSFSTKKMKLFKMGLFIFLLCPVLLSILLTLSRYTAFSLLFLGYFFWIFSFCLMYGILFFKKVEQEAIDMDDLNRHLIEDEI